MRVLGVRTGLEGQPAGCIGRRPEFDYVQIDQGILSVKAQIINSAIVNLVDYTTWSIRLRELLSLLRSQGTYHCK